MLSSLSHYVARADPPGSDVDQFLCLLIERTIRFPIHYIIMMEDSQQGARGARFPPPLLPAIPHDLARADGKWEEVVPEPIMS